MGTLSFIVSIHLFDILLFSLHPFVFSLHPLHLLLLHNPLGHLLILLPNGSPLLQVRIIMYIIPQQPQRGVDQLVCLLREVLLGFESGQ